MWICMNNGFVSIVEDNEDSEMVYVRARVASHLTEFMANSERFEITETPTRDYMYRIHVTKAYAGFRVAEHVMNIDYNNFKSSVSDFDLKRAYHMVWKDMYVGLDSRVDKMVMFTGG